MLKVYKDHLTPGLITKKQNIPQYTFDRVQRKRLCFQASGTDNPCKTCKSIKIRPKHRPKPQCQQYCPSTAYARCLRDASTEYLDLFCKSHGTFIKHTIETVHKYIYTTSISDLKHLVDPINYDMVEQRYLYIKYPFYSNHREKVDQYVLRVRRCLEFLLNRKAIVLNQTIAIPHEHQQISIMYLVFDLQTPFQEENTPVEQRFGVLNKAIQNKNREVNKTRDDNTWSHALDDVLGINSEQDEVDESTKTRNNKIYALIEQNRVKRTRGSSADIMKTSLKMPVAIRNVIASYMQ